MRKIGKDMTKCIELRIINKYMTNVQPSGDQSNLKSHSSHLPASQMSGAVS